MGVFLDIVPGLRDAVYVFAEKEAAAGCVLMSSSVEMLKIGRAHV